MKCWGKSTEINSFFWFQQDLIQKVGDYPIKGRLGMEARKFSIVSRFSTKLQWSVVIWTCTKVRLPSVWMELTWVWPSQVWTVCVARSIQLSAPRPRRPSWGWENSTVVILPCRRSVYRQSRDILSTMILWTAYLYPKFSSPP